MIAATALRDVVTVREEDPRAGEIAMLFAQMNTFMAALYPEDVELGIVPSTPEELLAGVFVVARLDGVAVGTGALRPHAPVDGVAAMEVKRMYVREEARGRRIAETVLDELIGAARVSGIGKLVLMCGPRQPSALRLYERCGFARRGAYGANPDDPLCIYFERAI